MNMIRRRLLPALLGAALASTGLLAGPATADTRDDGKALVQKMADQVIAILADKGIDRAAKEARLRQILGQNFDMPTIGSWVLGAPWREATAAQKAEYLRLFETYIVKVYTGQLSTYSGEK